MLIDTHCHLDKLELDQSPHRLNELLSRAETAGVKQILTISVDLDNFEQIYSLTEHAGIWASCGVHPLHEAGLLTTPERLALLAQAPKVVALGETGLDYFYDKEPANHQRQQQSFAIHLEVAGQQGLPTIVHTRDAKEDTLALIKQHGNRDIGGVLHCFTEDYDMAKRALDENYLISISGIVTFRNADDLRATVKKLPLESLLVETDSPYLAPVPHRGKKNEPSFVRDVAQFVADIKGVRYEALLEQTAANFFSKFSKADPSSLLN
ncbi:TatD family deoxyribonuclease [Maribrevibacterium harenarium]|uniref:TatD family deoxyribonuclease n=1 Tax=Maribrevibacterium harenarium TaxID=2589817 RepID=A0A501WBF6_9GAMM|nr:TatD family hydrolase [Maribrevibacterium harenarium]TPE47263.1 TatD family deoxyribonuclease [Maribrevibacterium harenarium]